MNDPGANGPLVRIAVIGMAGRFPGARNVDEFWDNLCNGVECISRLSDEDLIESGVPRSVFSKPSYVRAFGVLDGAAEFDASYFGFTPREAELLDPQHRLFLECCSQALGSAGHDPERFPGRVAVFAGAGLNSYLLNNLYRSLDLDESAGVMQALLGNDKDFVPTRVSYKLNLTGPSVNVNTACSTSLVAVQFACQSLTDYQCDMALAGGVRVTVPGKRGYMYQREGIGSPDGHCRAFDTNAQGTVAGDGVAAVLLKRLDDAIKDRNTIRAVIIGTAINNDGNAKVGYTAPSVEGQSEVIAEALAFAGIPRETISYIEAHGTATSLGDMIEVAALRRAFGNSFGGEPVCAIGSVKTNVGHLDAAAGVTGLIKTVLALEHGLIPPTLHFKRANPSLEIEGSGFYVNENLKKWEPSSGPRRAGVSSFGIGGTNVHIILEQAPAEPKKTSDRPLHMIGLSARTPRALERATANLAAHLSSHPSLNLGDVAYTLHAGRPRFEHRRFVVCDSIPNAARVLADTHSDRVVTGVDRVQHRPLAFMFPGGGSQHVNMGAGLYRDDPTFRQVMDQCAEWSIAQNGFDLRRPIYTPDAKPLVRPSYALPCLFATEYALARMWISWGIEPEAMIGHSLGEYVAATIAGVLSPEDAIALVTLRAQLFEKAPEGAMLSVPLSADEISSCLSQRLSIAAANGPAHCVVAGSTADIRQLQETLERRGLDVKRLRIAVAAHSELITPILDEFSCFVKTLEFAPPRIPYVSNVTGDWVTAEQVTDPAYWVEHLRSRVQFSDGARNLLSEPDRALLEVGPGWTLSTLVRQQPAVSDRPVLCSLPHPKDEMSDCVFVLDTLGRLWLSGVDFDYGGLYAGTRVPLPTYPFERTRHWVERGAVVRERCDAKREQAGAGDVSAAASPLASPDEWFYIPSWRRTMPPAPALARDVHSPSRWLLFDDGEGVGDIVAKRLTETGHDVIRVGRDAAFQPISEDRYSVRSEEQSSYDDLFDALLDRSWVPERILHLWSLGTGCGTSPGLPSFQAHCNAGYYSLLFVARSIASHDITSHIELNIGINELFEVSAAESTLPEKAPILGVCHVIPQELQNVQCRCIDVELSDSGRWDNTMVDRLVAELMIPAKDRAVAYRRDQRWVQEYVHTTLPSGTPARSLRDKGVYVITGGFGKVGMYLAEYLARRVQAKLVLIGRSEMPAREQWDGIVAGPDSDPRLRTRIETLLALHELGAETLNVHADVADVAQMRAAIAQVRKRFGALHGVIHGAALTEDASAFSPIGDIGRAESERQFHAKVAGLYALEEVLDDTDLDFCLLLSSNASVLGGVGLTAYAAANCFMDAFAARMHRTGKIHWISSNWDGWPSREANGASEAMRSSIGHYAMRFDEAGEVFERVVTRATTPQVVVSRADLAPRIDEWIRATHPPADRAVHGSRGGDVQSQGTICSQEGFLGIVSAVWRDELGIPEIDGDDNFFDLGGNSLGVIRMINRLEQDHGIRLHPRDFMLNSMGQIALLCETRRGNE